MKHLMKNVCKIVFFSINPFFPVKHVSKTLEDGKYAGDCRLSCNLPCQNNKLDDYFDILKLKDLNLIQFAKYTVMS